MTMTLAIQIAGVTLIAVAASWGWRLWRSTRPAAAAVIVPLAGVGALAAVVAPAIAASPMAVLLSVTAVGCGVFATHRAVLLIEGATATIDALRRDIAGMREESSARWDASEQRLEALARLAPIGLFEADGAGRLTYVSRRCAQILRTTRSAIVRGGWLDAVAESARQRVRDAWVRAIATSGSIELSFPLAASADAWAEIKATPIPGAGGCGETGFVGVVADVTERVHAEERRRDAERRLARIDRLESLERLAGGIAHEFNNRLVAILGNVELLRRALADAPQFATFLDEITVASMRSAVLARDLTAMAERNPGGFVRVDLVEEVNEILTLLRSSLAEKPRVIERERIGPVPVRADPSRLRQLIVRLATWSERALATTGPERTSFEVAITVRTVDPNELVGAWLHESPPQGRFAILSFLMPGVVLEPKEAEALFEPALSDEEHLELGLTVARGIARAHGGALAVAPGEGGTELSLFLPLAMSAGEGGPPRRQGEEHEVSARTVLVVDDDRHVLEATASILTSCGITAVAAHGGREAVSMVREQADRFDALVLDLSMSDLDGPEVFEEIRKLRPRLPVVVVSGLSEEQAWSRLRRDEWVTFVPKPFRAADVIGRLNRLIDVR